MHPGEVTYMKIREMKLNDYDEIYAMWLCCKGMGLNSADDTREGIERFLRRNPDTCFVAEEEGKIIGAIMVGSDGRRGHIYHTAVHPDYRHAGIGRALVERACEALKEIGIYKVMLVVFKRNEAGNAFWESLGFRVREDIAYRDSVLIDFERYDT